MESNKKGNKKKTNRIARERKQKRLQEKIRKETCSRGNQRYVKRGDLTKKRIVSRKEK